MSQKNNNNFYEILNDSSDEISTTINFEQKKKKGRKKIKKNLLSHNKCKKDNIRSNIMTHFRKFIISFLNDFSNYLIPNNIILFRKIDFKEREKLNIKYIKNFIEMKLSDFCKLKISKIYTKEVESNENQKNFENIKNYFPEEITKINIRNLYEKFYISQNFDLLKEKYRLTNTNNFFSLLNEKEKEGDFNYVNKLKETGLNLIKDLDKKKSLINDQTLKKKRFYGIKKEEEKKEINDYYHENIYNKNENLDENYIIYVDNDYMIENENNINDGKFDFYF